MDIARFETEHFFAPYEFRVPHLLSVSDCQSCSVGELLAVSGTPVEELLELRLGYTESLGHPDLRRAISEVNQGVATEAVMVLASPIEGIDLMARAILEPGDEVVVLTPCYDALRHVPQQVAGGVLEWPLIATEGGWSLDLSQLQTLLKRRPRLVMTNFPHNPTGFQPTLDQFRELVRLVERSGAWLYSDEMYRGLEFGAAPGLPSGASLSDRCVALGGLSKAAGLPGLRSGWLLAPDPALRAKLENWKFYTSICPPAPSEVLALAALRAHDLLLERNRALVRANLSLAEAFFQRHRQTFSWRPPQAGSVALVGVQVPSATAWCHQLAEDPGVLLLPGAFLGGGDQSVRFGFGRQGFGEALGVLDRALPGALAPRD